MGRKHVALQRRVARVLSSWTDPHDSRPYPELDIVQHVDIAEDGEVNMTVNLHDRTARAASWIWRPCESACRGERVSFVHIQVVDIPAAPRWTRAVNR